MQLVSTRQCLLQGSRSEAYGHVISGGNGRQLLKPVSAINASQLFVHDAASYTMGSSGTFAA
jgi:hypothetical protein